MKNKTLDLDRKLAYSITNMNVLLKLLIVPLVAFFVTLINAAILGSFLGTNELKELLGGTSAMPLWLAWCAVFAVGVIVQWMYKKWRNKD